MAKTALRTLKPTGKAAAIEYSSTEDLHRQQWTWDKVAWVSHCVDCYPGNCPFRAYVKDGIVLYEEPGATYQTIEEGVPDLNPMGCNKGAMWGQQLYAKERILYPLKRVGERGSGRWKRISWDQALTEVADAVIDAIQEKGPQSIVHEITGAQGGPMALGAMLKFIGLVGGVSMDLDGVVNDFAPGMYLTYGKIFASSVDDWFLSDVVLIWHMNPVYTRIPYYHYVSEARYKGATVVTIAPDFSPSATHADYHLPVRPGTDAALALAMCKTILDEGLEDRHFMKEQTDLPLLVRKDNGRYLREKDIKEGGRDDQFYWFDAKTSQVVEAPRGTLELGKVDPSLDVDHKVTLADGKGVAVTTVFQLVQKRLEDYTPEKAEKICGINPDAIRKLARKIASGRTNILLGFNSCKNYHADLMERAMCLLLGLTANWGRKGSGIRIWAVGPWPGLMTNVKMMPGPEGTDRALQMVDQVLRSIKAEDPTFTHELAVTELATRGAAMSESAPPAFFWYYHCGFKENWNQSQWHDPSMKRPFDDYMNEALEKNWWAGHVRPPAETTPRVYFECGGDALRRTRGGQNQLLNSLWPNLNMVVFLDWRMNTTGMFSDIILPVATHAEKIGFHFSTSHMNQMVFNDQSVEPQGETKSEARIFRELTQKVEERAQARNFTQYTDHRGMQKSLIGLYDRYTLNGYFDEDEKIAREWIEDGAIEGTLPEGTTIETLRKKGHIRFTDWGIQPMAVNQGSDLKPNEVHTPLRHHTENKYPFPTLTRRAQYLIDHDWFFEAGEELPVHKDAPKMGGDFPFQLTSGHPRTSIHAANIMNKIMQNTAQGRPFAYINPDDAAKREIREGDLIRAYNDKGSFEIWAKVAPSVRPGQLIVYNGYEPMMFRNWKDPSNTEPGMVKWLHLAGGYGHLRFRSQCWQPVPIDRLVRLEVERVNGSNGAAAES
ncbi:MAG TPA: molybdopterin-dependent oxidoreductase [Dehalococcoidia bacterium]|nr:molybdopterin-dependent oxidoreductase [Dehalococcoidia bacterium]